MIHAYALEPDLVATWGRRSEFRFFHDKFGLGTPRVMLELPSFSKWKRAVYAAATDLELSEADMKRIEELFRLLGDSKCTRADRVYDGVRTWLQNAEREYDRKPFAAILATANPSGHQAILIGDSFDPTNARWACLTGATPPRTPESLAATLSAMLINSEVLHMVDPHFGPENPRHRKVLEALLSVLASNGVVPKIVRVHCSAKSTLEFFEDEVKKMGKRLPSTITVEFVRWKQRSGGDKLHDRYVLTDLGGVMLGVGLDSGQEGETDNVLLLPQAIYTKRWKQYAEEDGTFERVDAPAQIKGTCP